MDQTFKRLRELLVKYSPSFLIVGSNDSFYLQTKEEIQMGSGKHNLFFAGVVKRKNVVSFYLMPIYINPELVNKVSPALKTKLTGKACFTIKQADDEIVSALDSLLKLGIKQYALKGWL